MLDTPSRAEERALSGTAVTHGLMAYLDTDSDEIVLRIVYDGAAQAGKTTSLRALARSLSRDVWHGEELDGRTLFLDWMEYVGGRFEGRAIRCQLISVPGQAALASRRRRLLETADAIVFVVDSTRARFEASKEAIELLQKVRHRGPQPSPGVLVQANKTDAPDVVAIGEVRATFEERGISSICPASALTGEGIRETFVEAVRLGLERARELSRIRQLPVSPPSIRSGEELVASLRLSERDDSSRGDSAASTGERAPRTSNADVLHNAAASPTAKQPPLPSAEQARGSVWPPIEGRALLRRVDGANLVPGRSEAGRWTVSSRGWRLRTTATAFPSEDAARQNLLRWVDWHTAAEPVLSRERCIAMVESADAGWLLWQVVEAHRSARDALIAAIHRRDSSVVARGLIDASLALGRAWRWAATGERSQAPIGLGDVAPGRQIPCLIGFAPDPEEWSAWKPPAIEQGLQAELSPIVENARQHGLDLEPSIRRLARTEQRNRLGELLCSMLSVR